MNDVTRSSAKPDASLRKAMAAACISALLGIASSHVAAQVERPSAQDSTRRGPGGPGPGRSRTVTPPDAAIGADPHNLNGFWRLDDSKLGGPGGPGGPGGGPGGSSGAPNGASPTGAAGGPPPGAAGGAPPGAGLDTRSKLECIPDSNVFAGGEGSLEIIQTPTQINMIAEENHKVKRIYLNGEHPKNLQPSYMGHSIGHWEGDTLVVDTVGLKGNIMMMGKASPTLHVIERIHKTDKTGASIEVATSYKDEATGKTSEGRTLKLDWNTGRKTAEWICEDYSDEYFKKDYK